MNRYNIGRRIEVYREKHHMSTQELAERISRSQATISRIENGKQGLTFELLSRIAYELHIHPFMLLSDEPLYHSVLTPVTEKCHGECEPNLLSNALRAGRIHRKMTIGEVAKQVGVSDSELEAIELSITSPGDELLLRLCELYGLVFDEVRMIQTFSDAVPDTARGLAYLQQLFSSVRHLIRDTPFGEERSTLDRIAEMIDSTDSETPVPADASADGIGLFLNRLALHVVNALKDRDFRSKIVQLAEYEDARDKELTERREE